VVPYRLEVDINMNGGCVWRHSYAQLGERNG
jgi:hypothetical protein